MKKIRYNGRGRYGNVRVYCTIAEAWIRPTSTYTKCSAYKPKGKEVEVAVPKPA